MLFHHLLTGYEFGLNRYTAPFAILVIITLFVIASYSRNYLDNELGGKRYWTLFWFFSCGMLISTFAANLKTFFVGWEIVGLASFFLIGFYQENRRGLENSLIALANYKICDVFFLLAIFGQNSSRSALAGLFLILATLAKSAQFPFSSWLYRALEGPTPSSTVFYGGLSLHLGPFLLLQFASQWDHSLALRALLAGIGIFGIIYGFLSGSARSDLKTSFAYASISQVGIIYVELSLGLYHLAMWHIAGHNLLRTWNYLRGASFFGDFVRRDFHNCDSRWVRTLFNLFPRSSYFHSLNGFYLDSIFLHLRRLALIGSLIYACVYVVLVNQGQIASSSLYLIMLALGVSVYLFLEKSLNYIVYFIGLLLSQALFVLSTNMLTHDFFEESYIALSLVTIGLLVFSLVPALKTWSHLPVLTDAGRYLGLMRFYPGRNWIFLVSAIFLTASPGSLQFFLQEELFDEFWEKSHLFLYLSLMCVSLNTVHIFRIGQAAFLGGETADLPWRFHHWQKISVAQEFMDYTLSDDEESQGSFSTNS